MGSSKSKSSRKSPRYERYISSSPKDKKLSDYQSLDNIVTGSSKNLTKKGYPYSKGALKYFSPEGYAALLLLEIAYRNKTRLNKAINKTARIWEKDAPISEKLGETAIEALSTAKDIIKKEGKDYIRRQVSEEFSDLAVDKLEDVSFIDTVSDSVGLPNHRERFKELVKDTINKEVNSTLEGD